MSYTTEVDGLITAASGDGSTLVLGTSGLGGVAFQLAGTFSATIAFEGSVDGLTFKAMNVVALNGATTVTSATTANVWLATITGLKAVRLRCSSYTSGAASAKICAIAAGGGGAASGGGGGGGGAVTVADGADAAQGATTDAAITNGSDGTLVGLLKGLNLRLLAETLDYDTGAGTATQVIFGLALPASGGPVAGGTNANPLSISQTAATGTLTNVVSSASNVTLISSNAARKRAFLFNDVDKLCYVKFGATATTSSFTKSMLPGEFFEVSWYTGIVDGIWESGPTGSMRVTELTA